jgi:16S rRNA processing protein RimM
MSGTGETILLGKVAATHGIKGQLRVVPYSGETATLCSLQSIMLKGPKGEMDVFPVATVTGHGRKVLLALKGFDNINQVQHLVGRELFAWRDQLPDLPPDEFYWFDLIGLTVGTTVGRVLGRLEEIIATGSNDVYVVRADGEEFLIPALADVVLMVDLENGVMTVDPPDGLFDL